MDRKWLTTTEILDAYERRFALARAQKIATRPWEEAGREKVLASVRRMLRYDEALIPTVHNMQEISRQSHDGYTAIQLRYETWEKVYGTSTLYLPHSEEKLPLVFVCCGHGAQGRLSESYLAMGHRLAQAGMAALVMDNIGQGDRNPTPGYANGIDHWFATEPFRCGLTLQGLIVMETIAMIRHMQKDPRFDPQRFAACGNSGGGTLTMFLAALAPELCAIASCGYPSEITYLLQKERRHCACNLLIGQAFEAEMWEIYSLFAPKPLLLSGGVWDDLIPMDLAHRNARKVKNAYAQLDALENIHFTLTKTKHPWAVEDLNVVCRFLAQTLLHTTPEDITQMLKEPNLEALHIPIPSDGLSTAELSRKLTGMEAAAPVELQDIFPPTFQGTPIDPEAIQTDVGRGDVMRIFAQFECTLYQDAKGAGKNG